MGVIRPEALCREAMGLEATGRREGSNGNTEQWFSTLKMLQNHWGNWFNRKNSKTSASQETQAVRPEQAPGICVPNTCPRTMF